MFYLILSNIHKTLRYNIPERNDINVKITQENNTFSFDYIRPLEKNNPYKIKKNVEQTHISLILNISKF